MSLFSQDQNNNININPLQKSQEEIPKPYHPLEFYSLGKVNPNLINSINNNNITSSKDNYSQKQPNSRLNYNYSSHELFNRNILSVNNPYFEKYKEVKPKMILSSSVNKDENNYLDPLNSIKVRKKEITESQKLNNINSLEWFHLIKNKVYIIDQDSKIKKGNNITRNKFYQEKGITLEEKDKNNIRGIDTDINNNNINRIKHIFNSKRYKEGNRNLSNENDIFVKGKEIKQIESENNYWKKLRIEKTLEGRNTIDVTDSKKFDEKKLKGNLYYFDKNHKNIIRHKNWWKIDP
jgi:hypothetical protein